MKIKKVCALQDKKYKFISDSQAVYDILKMFGVDTEEFDSCFVWVNEDGEYEEVWGMPGIIPMNDKNTYRIYPDNN